MDALIVELLTYARHLSSSAAHARLVLALEIAWPVHARRQLTDAELRAVVGALSADSPVVPGASDIRGCHCAEMT
jgi:hypothetical protein